ncbi:MAG: lytic transglycosylase domain-containing protein [Pseudomonadota bacterium]
MKFKLKRRYWVWCGLLLLLYASPEDNYPAMADQAAARYGIDKHLFRALITQESAWNPRAISSKGAIGLGQLMPATARDLGVDPYDPMQNLDGSARYLSRQIKRFKDVKLALCAYNAGPGKVLELGRCPRFKETQNYVKRIMRAWQERQQDVVKHG